jgi:hypothetical protein
MVNFKRSDLGNLGLEGGPFPMPLNRYNTRSSWRQDFGGITEYVTLKRRGPDGKFSGVQELWVAQAMPSTQRVEDFDGKQVTIVERQWHLFRRFGDRWQPPNVGDLIVRRSRDLTSWEIAPNAEGVERQLFGNSAYLVATVQVINPEKLARG